MLQLFKRRHVIFTRAGFRKQDLFVTDLFLFFLSFFFIFWFYNMVLLMTNVLFCHKNVVLHNSF